MKAAILAALASVAAATGTITIKNNCQGAIGIQIDSQGTQGQSQVIQAGGNMETDLSGAPGQAVKFSTSGDFAHPISFDYTIDYQDGKVYYDVSDVAGHPLDVYVKPADDSCPEVSCPASWPTSVCNQPRTCYPSSNYVIELCESTHSTITKARMRRSVKMAAGML
ncbi:uncharacterized protein PV09_00597 [Verruconis gallopava]|uniref:Antigenic thaumatin-like protein n=1 Tax=Verruconis gallopava TaxID=253628 RepID=A0A0D1Y0P4_9PEZI|nr:uncharacterized protein PV09_00597 [Verruconis gallopava]KIW08641.1 hypothetical protein PV09_00597 [Verruconis gallopava]